MALRRYLIINGSRYDLIRNNAPFVGTAPMPPDHGLYPSASRAIRWKLMSSSILVKRRRSTILKRSYAATPTAWSLCLTTRLTGTWVEPAAAALEQAATLSDDPHSQISCACVPRHCD